MKEAKEALTHRELKALKPAPKGRRLMAWDHGADLKEFGGSLGIRITDKGHATFVVLRRLGKDGRLIRRKIGKAWKAPLGDRQLPTSLSKTRDEARVVVTSLQEGIHPKEVEKQAAVAAQRAEGNRFGAAIKTYVVERLSAQKRGAEVRRSLERVAAKLGADRPLDSTTRAEVRELLAEAKVKHVYSAHHQYSHLRAFYAWAIGSERFGLENSPTDRISVRHVISVKQPRQHSLEPSEIKALWTGRPALVDTGGEDKERAAAFGSAAPARRRHIARNRARRGRRFRIQQGSAIDPQGFDAGKKVTGRKRHILVDTLGLLLGVSILPADIQDRDGSLALLDESRRRFPFVERIFADAGYQGPKMANVVADSGRRKLNIVKRSDLHRFVVLPKRWIVERTFAWISRNRRANCSMRRRTTRSRASAIAPFSRPCCSTRCAARSYAS